MHLTSHEVKRFYSIWFPLLHYVNQHRKLVPSFPKQRNAGNVSPEIALPLREALWEDDSLREKFIADNPANLSPADLALVDRWKHRVSDDFFIFRHLKKYTIFISAASPAQGYGVLGLTSTIEDITGPSLPIYVKAVLLPFDDRIIYDSLLIPYPILFGGGIRSSLKEAYRDIDEREGIITTLPLAPDTGADRRIRVGKSNKKVLTAFQKALGKFGLSPKMVQEHTSNLAKFADEFLIKQAPARLLLELTWRDIEAYQEWHTGNVNVVSFKRFVWFMRDTGRMDWDEAERLLVMLKSK